jgi:hypothetical protein
MNAFTLSIACLAALSGAARAQTFSPGQVLEQAAKLAAEMPPVEAAPPAAKTEYSPAEEAAIRAARELVSRDRERLGGQSVAPQDLPPVTYVAVLDFASVLSFGPQLYRGVPIEGTEIQVRLIGRPGVAPTRTEVSGRWVDVSAGLPTEPRVSDVRAHALLVGARVPAPTLAGKPRQITLSEADLTQPGERVYARDAARAPRLAWRVVARQDRLSWALYVDAETGALIRSEPLFASAL